MQKKNGYDVMAINSAEVDLGSLTNISNDNKVHLSGFHGAGKNREIGKNAFCTHQEQVIDKIKQNFIKANVIFPVFSLGGGTGSGIGPVLTECLADIFPNKIISPIVFFPRRNEVPRVQMNSLEAFSELSSLQNIGATFLIDNDKSLQRSNSNTLKEKYSLTNNRFFEFLSKFNHATLQNSEFGTLDKMDLATTFSERGNAIFTDVILDHNTVNKPENILNRIHEILKHQSFFTNFPLTNATNISVIFETPNNKTTSLDIESIFSHSLSPMELFKGIYVNENCTPTLSFFMTGLPYPSERLNEMEETIQQKEEILSNSMDKAQTQQYNIKRKWNDSFKRKKTLSI